jgi:hypothetical protein
LGVLDHRVPTAWWIASFYLSPFGFHPLFIVCCAEQTAVASVQRAGAARYLLEGRFPRSMVLNAQAVVGIWNRAVSDRYQKLNLKKFLFLTRIKIVKDHFSVKAKSGYFLS